MRSGAPSMDTLVNGDHDIVSGAFVHTDADDQSVTDEILRLMAGMHNLYIESAAMIVTLITVGKSLKLFLEG